MTSVRGIRATLALLAPLLLLPAVTNAQSTGIIAGVARDSSGAVMPGVTVEAASPALIERVRTATTDGEGQYKLVDLTPGTYTVTFTLTGFTTVKREGVQLSAGFTASINAELRVGACWHALVLGSAPI